MKGTIVRVAGALALLASTSARGEEPPATPSPAASPAATPAPDPAATSAAASSAIPDLSASTLDQMSLEELLNVPIAAASRERARPVREAPGVVTLITRDQIAAMGARDLTDVLLLVPGFGFGVDVEGVVAPSFRGAWAEEGKVLLLIDGHAMNELLYDNLPLGGRFPVSQIERIEIVRGPGSVSYGDCAELAVINVVTLGGHELAGHAIATALSGQMGGGAGHRDLSLSWGGESKDPRGLSGSLAGFFGTTNRSDARFFGSDGTAWNMANDSALDDLYLNAKLGWRGLDVRWLTDDYVIHQRDSYGRPYPVTVRKEFRQHTLDVRYPIALGGDATLTPRFSYARHNPWRTLHDQPFPGNASNYYDAVTARFLGEADLEGRLAPGLRGFAGVSLSRDDFFPNSTRDGVSQHGFIDQVFGGTGTVDDHGLPFYKHSYSNAAAFGETSWDTALVNVVAGARFEHHSRFGSTFVPRLALTHAFDRVHVKLLANRAYRAPSMGDLDYNSRLKPEITTVLEAEAGIRIGEKAFLSANVFDITIEKPIVFTVAATGTSGYFNYAHTGSRGVEASLQGQIGLATVSASVSYASAAGKNRVGDYAVPGHGDLTLGFPHMKVTAQASMPLGGGFSAGGTGVWSGERFGVDGFDAATSAPIVSRSAPALLLNAQLAWRGIRDLDLSLGLYNALGSRFGWYEAYAGGHPLLPAEARELTLRGTYIF